MIFFTRMDLEPIMDIKAIAWTNNIHWTKSAWIHNPTKCKIYPKIQNIKPEISKKRSFWEYLNPTSLRIASCSFFVGLQKPSAHRHQKHQIFPYAGLQLNSMDNRNHFIEKTDSFFLDMQVHLIEHLETTDPVFYFRVFLSVTDHVDPLP